MGEAKSGEKREGREEKVAVRSEARSKAKQRS